MRVSDPVSWKFRVVNGGLNGGGHLPPEESLSDGFWLLQTQVEFELSFARATEPQFHTVTFEPDCYHKTVRFVLPRPNDESDQ